MTQVVNAKDAKEAVEGVIGAATTVVMDGTAGLISGKAVFKNGVKTGTDVKSSTSKDLFKINLKFSEELKLLFYV